MFKETVEAIGTGVSVYELAAKSLPLVTKLVRRVISGEMAIAVFGCGGTGKTTFGKILSGESNPLVLAPYEESSSLEKFQVDRDISVSVIVPPGQDRNLRADQRKLVLEQVFVGKIKVVINAVAYGYHSFGALSYTESKLYQPGMSVDQFLAVYTEERRKEEIEQLKKIAPILQMAKSSPTLMLTLITKQDLWWQERNSVREYYLQSDYHRMIEEILRTKGSYGFSHEYVSTSLVINNFDSARGERLASVASGYDQRLQITNFQEVLNTIDLFCKQR